MKSSFLVRKLDPNNLILVLQSWRLWLLGAILGAIGGGLIFQLTPPSFQAEAIVSIDHNLEQAWPFPMDKSEFVFIGRETHKLELVAWGDGIFISILTNNPKYLEEDLALSIDKSQEGAWGFYATADNKQDAENIVNSWVLAFEEEVISRIDTTFEIEKKRTQILDHIAANPNISVLEIEQEIVKIEDLLDGYSGISPYLEIDIIQFGKINSTYQLSKSIYLLFGSFLGIVSTLFISIIKSNENKK
jgi:hypothetical protein